jgi:hypothetical protein
MPSNAQVKALEELYIDLGVMVEAAEQYPKVYRRAKRQYGQLLRVEQQFDLSMRNYFAGLPARILHRVNWVEYQHQVAAWDVQVDITQQDWQTEESLMFTSAMPGITTATRIGAAAAEQIFTVSGQGVPVTEAAIQTQAAQHAAELVKGLAQTTKDQLNQSIQTSLKQHESYDEAAARLSDTLDSSYRAELIARTETVRAYSAGVVQYGSDNGAVSKTWRVADNPCPICESMADTTVAIDAEFLYGDLYPPAHPACRCGIELNMASDEVPVDFGD